jgi:hypothetical protein
MPTRKYIESERHCFDLHLAQQDQRHHSGIAAWQQDYQGIRRPTVAGSRERLPRVSKKFMTYHGKFCSYQGAETYSLRMASSEESIISGSE